MEKFHSKELEGNPSDYTTKLMILQQGRHKYITKKQITTTKNKNRMTEKHQKITQIQQKIQDLTTI